MINVIIVAVDTFLNLFKFFFPARSFFNTRHKLHVFGQVNQLYQSPDLATISVLSVKIHNLRKNSVCRPDKRFFIIQLANVVADAAPYTM